MPTQKAIQSPIPRPPPSPTDPGRALYESGLIGFGYVRISVADPEFRRERLAYGFPAIALPRKPYELQLGRDPFFVADRNIAGFLTLGEPIRRRPLTDQGLFNDWIDVHPQLVGDMLAGELVSAPEPASGFPWKAGPLPLSAASSLHKLSAALRASAASDPLLVEEVLIDAVHQIIAAGQSAQATSKPRATSTIQASFHRDATEHIRRQLACTPERPHRLVDLAASVHLSPFHLCRIFKRIAGQPIHRYLEQLRIRIALAWVLDTDERMIIIAKRTGFCSEAHLSNAFLKAFGERPSTVRQGRRSIAYQKSEARRA